MVEAILYDVGGVLLELEYGPLFEYLGLSGESDPQAALTRLGGDPAYDAFERGSLNEDEFRELSERELGKTFVPEEFRTKWNGILVRTFPGVEEMINGFQGFVPQWALTNSNSMHMQSVVDRFGWVQKLDGLVSSHEIGVRKPEADAFLVAIEQIGKPADRILYFDDREENIQGAKAVGLDAVLVKNSPDDILRAIRERSH